MLFLKGFFIVLFVAANAFFCEFAVADEKNADELAAQLHIFFNDIDEQAKDQAVLNSISLYQSLPSSQKEPTAIAIAKVLQAEYLYFIGDQVGAKLMVADIIGDNMLRADILARAKIVTAGALHAEGQFQEFHDMAEAALNDAYQIGFEQSELIQVNGRSRYILYMAKALSFVSAAKAQLGRFGEARTFAQDTLDYLEFFENDPRARMEILSPITATYAFLGDLQKALEIQLQIVELNHQVGTHHRLEFAYFTLGRLYHRVGMLNESYVAHQEAYKFAEQSGRVEQIARSYYGLGLAAAKLNMLDDAISYFSRALPVFSQTRGKRYSLLTQVELANVYQRQGNVAAAMGILNQVWPSLESTQMYQAQARAAKMMAEITFQEQDFATAYQHLNRYINLSQRLSETDKDKRDLLVLQQHKEEVEGLKLQLQAMQRSARQKQFVGTQSFFDYHGYLLLAVVLLSLFCIYLWWKYKLLAQQWQNYQSVDPATGILTASAMYTRLDEEFSRFGALGQSCALAFMSIRETPSLKQLLGRKEYKQLNIQVIQSLCENIPPHAVLGHHHDDQFMVLMPGMTEAQAEALITPLVEIMSTQQFTCLGEKNLSLAIGCAHINTNDVNMIELIQRAADKLEQDELFSRHTFSSSDSFWQN